MNRIAVYALISCSAFCSQAIGQNGFVSVPGGTEPKTANEPKARLAGNYGKLPLSFEANTGQVDKSVRFLSRGSGYGLYLTGDQAVLDLRKGDCGGLSTRGPVPSRSQAACQQDVVRMRLAGTGAGAAAPVGEEQLPGMANYFIGNDPAKWHTGVPTYAKVRYPSVYPGVDLVYYGNQRQLEYDFVVAPGADPKAIRLQFAGATGLRLGANGDLVVKAAGGALAFHKPLVYQLVDGRRKAVDGGFTLLAKRAVGFRLGNYDRGKPLVIDPVLGYSTYLGGTVDDNGAAIAVDSAGSAYVAGWTSSADFPVTQGTFQTTHPACTKCGAAFITKLSPSGTALVYSNFLGGSAGGTSASGVAVDGAGNAYITGSTGATDFPVTPGAYQTKNRAAANNGSNTFITKLNPAGSALVYSTYLGGSGSSNPTNTAFATGEYAAGLAVDGAGNAYVTGFTTSTDFPVSPGAFQTTSEAAVLGAQTGFVAKLNPAGTALVYATYLGGNGANGPDRPAGLAVDGAGDAYITGFVNSTDFPVTAGAFQMTNRGAANGFFNGFITKLNPAGTALVYSSYLGGSSLDSTSAVAVDGSGNAYLTGSACSTDFPVTPGAYQTVNHVSPEGTASAFITKLNPAGSALVYSTFIGGSDGIAGGSAIAIDGSGNAYIVGASDSSNYPVTQGAYQPTDKALLTNNSLSNGIVSKLDPTGSTLLYSTYLGGSGYYYTHTSDNTIYIDAASDEALAVAVDGSGNVYVTGQTCSTDFPVTPGAFQATDKTSALNGNAFVTKLNLGAGASGPSISPNGIVPADSTVGTIQSGEWIEIWGAGLASAAVSWDGNFPITLGGTSVTIDGKDAYLSYVSPGQIDAQVPNDTTIGTVSVVVTTGNESASANVTLGQFAPSFFLADSKHVASIIVRPDGSGAHGEGANSYDYLGPTGDSLGYPTVAAKAGDIVELYGTGFGPTGPPVLAGQLFTGAAPTLNSVGLLINTVSVVPLWAGLSGAGLVQINVKIPPGLGTGDVPLVATVGGAQTPSTVVISLQ